MVFVPPSPGPFYARPPSPIPLSRTPSQRSEISGRKPHQIWAPVVPSPPGSYYVPLPPPDMFYVPPPSPGPYYVPPLPPGPFYSPLPSPGSYILPPLPPGPFYSPPSPNPYTLPPPLPPGPFYSPPLPPPPIPYYIPHTPSYETLSQRPETNIPVPHRVIWAPGGDILKLAYHPDGRRVVCCFDDGTIRVWNLENGEQEGASMEHTSTYVGTLALTGDGTRIISCDEDGSIRMWDIESRELVREWTYQGGNPELAISPDDQLIAVGSWMVFFYTTEGRQLDHSITVGKVVRSLSFSPSGDKLACGTRSDIYVYDVANGTLLLGPLQGHKDNVDRLLWSHDGGRLFSASRDRTVRCWNPDTGEQIGEPWIHNYSVLSLSLSPDGSKLASASYGGVRFWDTISASPMTHHLPHVYGVNAVSFSPSGEFVASAELHGKLSLWRAPWLDPIESPV
ncbi:WD40 repeat-like protein [Imleria badia]|nr:WD40 repeat-like protein [Imleria badia]